MCAQHPVGDVVPWLGKRFTGRPGRATSAAREEPSRPPAYVLGGYEGALAVVRSLGSAGVPVVVVQSSPHEYAWHSRHVHLRVRAPDPERHEEDFVASLVRLGEAVGEGVLIPTTDETVGAVARHASRLAGRYLLAAPSSFEVARRFLDKQLTYEIASRDGVDIPRWTLPQSELDLKRCASEVSFPCVVKPRQSHLFTRAFGVKMTKVSDLPSLRTAWQSARCAGIDTIVQENIPGPESAGVNYNAYFLEGRPVAEVTAVKVRLFPRDFGYPSAVLSQCVPEAFAPARAIVRGLGLGGFANVEFKRDARDGRLKLMEVNGRPNMSGWLSVRCGTDFPLIMYRHLVEGRVPRPTLQESGMYWIHEFGDFKAIVSRVRGGEGSLREHVAPYLGSPAFATFNLRDPLPFLKRVGATVSGRNKGGGPPPVE